MGEIKDNQYESAESLRMDRCPECGYLFTGLPDSGVCPECGFAYDREMIVLYGWGFGRGPTWADTRWGVCLAALLVLAPVGGILLMIGPDLGAIVSSLVIAGTIAVISAVAYPRMRQLRREVPPAQARLCAKGLGQRCGVGRMSLEPWCRQMIITMRAARPGRYRLIVTATNPLALRVRPQIVDLDFQASPAVAQHVLRQVEGWWFGSHS